LNPKYITAYMNRALLKKEFLNDYTGAILDCNAIIQINANDPRAYYLRGQLFALQTKMSEACRDFNKAMKLGFAAAQNEIDKYCKQ